MVPLTRLCTRLRRHDSGSELVEAALTFPLLLLVVLGILDFGLLFQQYEVITNAAREGARIAALPDYSGADAEFRAQQYINAAFLAKDAGTKTTVTVGPVTCVAIGSKFMRTRTVTVTYPHEYIFVSGVIKYFKQDSTLAAHTLTASSTMRTEAEAGTCP